MNATSLLQVEGSTLPGKCGPGNPFRLAVLDEGNSEHALASTRAFQSLERSRRPFTTSICGLAQLTSASTPAAASRSGRRADRCHRELRAMLRAIKRGD